MRHAKTPLNAPKLAPGKVAVHGGVVQDRVINVVSAIIVHPTEKRVLLCKRANGKALGGKWEFPGGKVEQGETPMQALQRELREELGIEIKAAQEVNTQYITQSHGQKVRITTYAVLQHEGEVQQDHSVHSAHAWISNLSRFAPRVISAEKFLPNWWDLFNSLFKGYVVHKIA